MSGTKSSPSAVSAVLALVVVKVPSVYGAIPVPLAGPIAYWIVAVCVFMGWLVKCS